MAFSISRNISARCLASGTSCLNICAFTVRRNASSTRHLLSDASTISFLCSSKQEAVYGKKTTTVSSLLKEYGFTDAHISKLQSLVPCLFKLDPVKNLPLKLKFIESIGLSKSDIPKYVFRTPYLLASSLEKKLIPCYEYLKNIPMSEEQLNQVLRSHSRILTSNLEMTIAPNVELLRGMRVPLSIITYCVTRYYLAVCCSHALFKSSVDQAIGFGLKPSTKTFIVAVKVLCGISKEKWDRKMDIYRGFGLSDDEILLSFRKQPNIMAASEKKIARSLEVFLKELGWAPAAVATSPVVLLYSLEKRVIPRCQVLEMLKKTGLSNVSATAKLFSINKEEFANRFIHRYKDDVPALMDIFKGYGSSISK